MNGFEWFIKKQTSNIIKGYDPYQTTFVVDCTLLTTQASDVHKTVIRFNVIAGIANSIINYINYGLFISPLFVVLVAFYPLYNPWKKLWNH